MFWDINAVSQTKLQLNVDLKTSALHKLGETYTSGVPVITQFCRNSWYKIFHSVIYFWFHVHRILMLFLYTVPSDWYLTFILLHCIVYLLVDWLIDWLVFNANLSSISTISPHAICWIYFLIKYLFALIYILQ